MISKTYRKIRTEWVTYSEEYSPAHITLTEPTPSDFLTKVAETMFLTVPQARQLHAELGEVLKAIEGK